MWWEKSGVPVTQIQLNEKSKRMHIEIIDYFSGKLNEKCSFLKWKCYEKVKSLTTSTWNQ